jgi:predicted DNA binding protein
VVKEGVPGPPNSRRASPSAARYEPADELQRQARDVQAVVKLRFEMPHGGITYQFTRRHPEILILITSAQPLSAGRVLVEASFMEPRPSDHSEELGRMKGVESVVRLGPVGPQTRYQVIAREPSYLETADKLEVVLRYPRAAQNGEYFIEVASSVSHLRRLIGRLRRISPKVTIAAFGRDRPRRSPTDLTARQSALLRQALLAGYFDVPRRISLTGLAQKLGRSKSSVSHGLALVERSLAERRVTGAV